MKKLLIPICLLFVLHDFAQQVLTPELLMHMGRVNGIGMSRNKLYVLYSVARPDIEQNKIVRKRYYIPVTGGTPVVITNIDSLLRDDNVSPDSLYKLLVDTVKLKNIYGIDFYPSLTKSNVQIYDGLGYHNWDHWEDGKYYHLVLTPIKDSANKNRKDLLENEPYSSPRKNYSGMLGGNDYGWSPDSKRIVYVCKKSAGTAAALTTNYDLYEYDISSGTTNNISIGNPGLDFSPAYNALGDLAWLQVDRSARINNKFDLVVRNGTVITNLTKNRDDIWVESFLWSDDAATLFFIAPVNGSMQIFSVNNPAKTQSASAIKQITHGDFDVDDLIGQAGNRLLIAREDYNHARELFSVDINNGEMMQLTHVNDEINNTLAACKTVRRFVPTSDHKKMLTWVIYPPGFDSTKKYPSLLYCEGGPHASLTQFFSFRWNFKLMASMGYIVIAPARRGMPGFGVNWDEIYKDWGGQVIDDYLSAVDYMSGASYIDTSRRGCVGASFGGYSVFALAGRHQGRFKTFIAHDGIFDLKSFYGTVDVTFYVNEEMGGPYWDQKDESVQRAFQQSPSNLVKNWNTPIMIIQGGRDFRVGIEQGEQAFTAAQLRNIKSRFLYFPEENHWVLSPQNSLVWQHEFYKWLDETLK